MGFGAEWAFAPNWSWKTEVLYARFEKEENTFTCRILCNPDRPVRFEHESSAWVTRFGINYRFGGGTYGGGCTAAALLIRATQNAKEFGAPASRRGPCFPASRAAGAIVTCRSPSAPSPRALFTCGWVFAGRPWKVKTPPGKAGFCTQVGPGGYRGMGRRARLRTVSRCEAPVRFNRRAFFCRTSAVGWQSILMAPVLRLYLIDGLSLAIFLVSFDDT